MAWNLRERESVVMSHGDQERTGYLPATLLNNLPNFTTTHAISIMLHMIGDNKIIFYDRLHCTDADLII